MSDAVDRVSAFVDALVKNRRPARFRVGPGEGEMLSVAALLRTAAPRVDDPDPVFVERLRGQLDRRIEPVHNRGVTRRRLLRGFGIPGAAALVGAAAGAFLRERAERLWDTSAGPELIPVASGAWTPVMPLDALATGEPTLFTVGAVRGFLIRAGESDVTAVSAVCTHLGCLLAANPQTARLDCPCHGAAFALDGAPLNPDYTTPLPRLRARILQGTIEVFAI
jgi:cytochrome b6-f complex iron-sulfur subunit